jgi:ABC-type phosphate/phosphonate transport system substrate-binding protein
VLGASLNVTFVNVYLNFTTTYTAVQNKQLDFIYTNPSIFSCLETQNGVNAVASIQSLRPTAVAPYTPVPQSVFGGTFFALSNRTDVNHISDIAGKRLEGADLTGLGAGQAQWRELAARNLSFWNLPSVVIFNHNQNGIAVDVASGYADVGMVRTDLLESLQVPSCITTSTITCFPPGTFKILDPKPSSVLPAGFPFNSSTMLYPEWPVAALPHVGQTVQKAVAQALMALNSTTGSPTAAYTTAAKISTFTTPLNYADLRTMQQSLGWIVNGSCITSTQTYATIVCDPGTFKRSQAVLNTSCASLNLTCKTGYDCTWCVAVAHPPPSGMSVAKY